MNLDEQIVEWAKDLEPWHRDVLHRLSLGETIGPQECSEIAEDLASGVVQEASEFSIADNFVPVSGEHAVRLVAVRNIQNVNALLPDQSLTVGLNGLTVVYGNNGSGKSGYARVVKQAVRARHHEEVLSNVFERPGGPATSQISLDVDGTEVTCEYPADPCPELGKISFFDESCGEAYVSDKSEVTYRPPALTLLDGLIRVCDGVRVEIDRLLSDNTADARLLPDVAPNTRASAFLDELSAATTDEEIAEATSLTENADEEMQRLASEEARLRATDPDREKGRLLARAKKYDRLQAHFLWLREQLGQSAADVLNERLRTKVDSAAAASAASERNFEAEPLKGVGSGPWHELWDAARAFTEAEAYAEQPFPVAKVGARCVLCQQKLDSDSADRLARFEDYVQDHTQQAAQASKEAFDASVRAVSSVQPAPPEISQNLEDLESDSPDLMRVCQEGVENASARKASLLASVEADEWLEPSIAAPKLPVERLASEVTNLQQLASELDSMSFQAHLDEVVKRRSEMGARRQLVLALDDVIHEIARCKRRDPLEAAKRTTTTTRITKKSIELTRIHVTTLVRDWFTREVDRLRLERVTLEDHGGQKGQLRHQPAFVGAVQQAKLPRVLSEGEQTALGLAGFFTEVHFDRSQSAVVLDDPVSSLDHTVRKYVARRLGELSVDRQVIVFTHDVSFVSDLRKVSDEMNVEFTERSVSRRGPDPGLCHEGHPWKARDARSRLGQLEHDLATIKKGYPNWDSDRYEKEVASWAGDMSETWERIINLEVIEKVVDRTSLEVRTRMFRILAQIDDDDNDEFQASFGRCTEWARRHDKSPELNYVAPSRDPARFSGVGGLKAVLV